MMTPICPRFLNLINDVVLLRFRARTPEDLSAIEVIYLFIIIRLVGRNGNGGKSYLDCFIDTTYNYLSVLCLLYS